MAFVPRRSARLAALAAAKDSTASTQVVDVSPNASSNTPSNAPRLVIEEIRDTILNTYKAVLDAKNGIETYAALKNLPTVCACSVHSKPGKPTKEEARATFLTSKGKSISTEMHRECIATLKRYLDDCENTRGRTAKTVIATKLVHYMISIPEFLASYDRFHLTVLNKMNEFKQEGEIPDAVIDADFRKAVDDILFVIA
jgi:hypothetical protein